MQDGLPAGTIVQRYRIEERVGVGGMGSVYRATHLETGEAVALKTLHRHVAGKSEYQKRFLREARAAMAVPHANIVRILEVFEHEGAPVLAMELLVGETLEAVLNREKQLPLDRLARILVRVTSAIGTAHSLGIIHRDLKPDNIFIIGGDDRAVKVVDFGIAKLTATEGAAAQTAALTRTGALIGTPFYMSPEQAFGEKKIDQRADIWSIGIILYQGLSGVLPTHGRSFGDVFRIVVQGDFPPVERLVPGLPDDVVQLAKKMLQRDPVARPWDLREVHGVLERYAKVSAPLFGVAVAPLFEELTQEADSESRPRDPVPAPAPSGGGTVALTPSGLRFAPTAGRASSPTASRPSRPPPGGITPGGTVAMEPEPSRSRPPPAPPSAPRSRMGLIAVVLAVVALVLIAALVSALR